MKKQPIATYKFEEVLEQTTLYFKGDTLAASVWINKYALKDSAGNIYERTPDDMHRRIAKEIARIEKRYPNSMNEAEIFDLLQNFKYIIPQGSPMAGIGNNFQIVFQVLYSGPINRPERKLIRIHILQYLHNPDK